MDKVLCSNAKDVKLHVQKKNVENDVLQAIKTTNTKEDKTGTSRRIILIHLLTSQRTRTVFPPTTFKTCPRVLQGIKSPSIPGTSNGSWVSTNSGMRSTEVLLLISNKDDIPTDLSRKLNLLILINISDGRKEVSKNK